MLSVHLLLALSAPQGQEPVYPPYDTSELATLVEAREKGLGAHGWKFSVRYVSAEGAVVDQEGEPADEPISRHQLWFAEGAMRRHSVDHGRGLDVTAVVNEGALSVLTAPIKGSENDVPGTRPVFQRGGDPDEFFLASFFPESFGLGYAGYPLSEWFRDSGAGTKQFLDLGKEEVLGHTCQKLLFARTGAEDGGRIAQAVMWFDLSQTLLLLKAHSLTDASLAPTVTEDSLELSLDGRDYVSSMKWEVTAYTNTRGTYLPVSGSFRHGQAGPVAGMKVQIEPVFPDGAWPSETFVLEPHKGVAVRDGNTGAMGIFKTNGRVGVFVGELERSIAHIVTAEGMAAPPKLESGDDVWLDATCGSVATYTYLRLLGRAPDPNELVRSLGDKGGDTSVAMDAVAACVRGYGVPVFAYEMTPKALQESLAERELVLLQLELPGVDVGHYVVGFPAEDGLRIYDAKEGHAVVPYDALSSLVKGNVRLLVGREIEASQRSWVTIVGVALLIAAVALAVFGMRRRGAAASWPVSAALVLLLVPLASCGPTVAEASQQAFERIAGSPLAVEGGVRINLGEQQYGSTARHEVRVRNDGDEPLHIDRVVTTCGCSTAGMHPERLAPGQEGVLRVSVSMDVRLRRDVRINLASSSRDPAWLGTLHLSAFLAKQNMFVVEPREVHFGKDGVDRKSFDLLCHYPEGLDRDPWFDDLPEWLEASIEPRDVLAHEVAANRRYWACHVQAKDGVEPGVHKATLKIIAQTDRELQIPVELIYTKLGNLQLHKRDVFLGSALTGDVERFVPISRRSKDVKVTSVEADSDLIAATWITQGEAEGVRLRYQHGDAARGGMLDAYVEIRSSPGNSFDRIHVVGRVSR